MKATVATKATAAGALPIALMIVGGSLLLANAGAVAVGPGCESLPPATIQESPQFTPADERRAGQRPESPILQVMPSLDDRAAIASYPNAVDGLSVQHASSVAAGSAFLFYLEKPLEIDLTPSRFYAAGGIAYLIEPRDGGESFADSLPALIGDRATAVAVGPHPGMLTWADPTIEGVRSHNLYWADGRNNYSMIGVREPERLVNLAREVVCRSQ